MSGFLNREKGARISIMARKSTKKKKVRKKKKKKGSKIVFFLLFVLTALLIYVQRDDLVAGIQGHFLGNERMSVIKELKDIPSPGGLVSQTASIVGIPDYGHTVRFPYREKILTCFRMTDFGNRLFVCTEKGLKQPEEIGDVLTQHSVQGKLTLLKKSRVQDTLSRGFQRSHRIFPADDACLLFEGESSLPSFAKTLVLCLCLIFCCFFLFRFIK